MGGIGVQIKPGGAALSPPSTVHRPIHIERLSDSKTPTLTSACANCAQRSFSPRPENVDESKCLARLGLTEHCHNPSGLASPRIHTAPPKPCYLLRTLVNHASPSSSPIYLCGDAPEFLVALWQSSWRRWQVTNYLCRPSRL